MPPEQEIVDKIQQALSQIQRNKAYAGAKENTINDGLRDMLNMVYDCCDQTRQGVSETEIDSGFVDILLKRNSMPFSIIESVRLKGLEQENLKRHIDKVLTKYDDNGCIVVNLVIYGMMADFAEFWRKLEDFLENYGFPYPVVEEFCNINTGYAESRHGKVKLDRQATEVAFHIFALHMR